MASPAVKPAVVPAALSEHAIADVCVVGGGLSGLSTALMCAKAGLSVVLLESRAVGAGMSGRSSGAAPAWDPHGFATIQGRHGRGVSRSVARARGAGLDWVTKTVRKEKINCGFKEVPAYLLGGNVDKELEACREVGLDGSTSHEAPAGNSAGAAKGLKLNRLPGGAAELDPVRFARGLAEALERHGGRIYEGTRVKSGPFTISGKVVTLAANSVDGPIVRASKGVVLATHSPINRSLAVHSRQSPWRTYNITFELPKGASGVPDALLYSLDGHHARVVDSGAGRRLLLVGGGDSDHVVGQMRERYGNKPPFDTLEAWARTTFPSAGRVVQRWSSVVFRPADIMGLFGVNPLDVGSPKTRLITGTSGDAVVGAAMGAMAVAGDILGEAPEWARVFEPSRLSSLGNLGSLGDLGTEVGLNVRGYARVLTPTCWRDVVGLVAPGSAERAIKPGDGQVVQEGLRKVALYRDEQGTLHRHSALCPHQHVLVQWNPVDKTFDCPGHGSVFDPCGRCVSGPSSRDLEDLGWRREDEGRGEGGGNLVK
ncbi:FAD dependent oxidoreductase [Monoraphidium neglectum]|uniref:FAD dependent oxidoreductase n=1 Tax=Monoraphidium neglectum TaxID=145388 RepID=A0A0D2K2E0_9CHLO|nr:FAD dependent oxidoreductase [Monoraphidium neglectum]KIZ04708.1 FAD dependent oxidoreductase [Monoraphidium neglectum]|eukprot:XP_013903727.1 FAD dependent oxidoreductase [Monoraphidium neglectum]